MSGGTRFGGAMQRRFSLTQMKPLQHSHRGKPNEDSREEVVAAARSFRFPKFFHLLDDCYPVRVPGILTLTQASQASTSVQMQAGLACGVRVLASTGIHDMSSTHTVCLAMTSRTPRRRESELRELSSDRARRLQRSQSNSCTGGCQRCPWLKSCSKRDAQ